MILLLPLTTEPTTLVFWILALGDKSRFPFCCGIAMAESLAAHTHTQKLFFSNWPINLHSHMKNMLYVLLGNMTPKGS